MSNELRQRALELGDKRSSLLFYRGLRLVVRTVVFRWLRVVAHNEERLNTPGPVVVAPVHRSNLDSVLLGSLGNRRQRALGKESLFTVPVVRWLSAALGAIPVKRGAADRESLVAAKELLERGESMIVFPEGSRQSGNDVTELFGGAAWLSARAGATVIPVGIAGTETALPSGAKFLRRSKVEIVVGEPMAPPGADGRRAGKDALRDFTAELTVRLQAAQDAAVAAAARR